MFVKSNENREKEKELIYGVDQRMGRLDFKWDNRFKKEYKQTITEVDNYKYESPPAERVEADNPPWDIFKKGFKGGYQMTDDEFWKRFAKSEGHKPTKKK